MQISEELYNRACEKKAEYLERKMKLMEIASHRVPPEMSSMDIKTLLDFLHDGLNDAYADLMKSCDDVIETYERADKLELIKELTTIGRRAL